MKKVLLSGFGVLGLCWLVACGKSSSDNTDQTPACGASGFVFVGSACIPQSALVPLNANGTCPAGYLPTSSYCYPSNLAGISGVIPSIGFYSDNYSGRNGLTQKGQMFKTFLKEAMGVCDRTGNVGGYYSCDSWALSQFDVVIQAPSTATTMLKATLRIADPMNLGGYGQWGYIAPSSWGEALFGIPSSRTYYGAVQNPLVIDPMAVSIINGNQGFEARGNGNYYTAANSGLIQIQVNNGKLDNPWGFDYKLLYKGQVIVEGKMSRCQRTDCGLSMPIGWIF